MSAHSPEQVPFDLVAGSLGEVARHLTGAAAWLDHCCALEPSTDLRRDAEVCRSILADMLRQLQTRYTAPEAGLS